MKILIPFICALLYRAGGSDQWKWCPLNQKLWRWLGIGIFTGITFAILNHSWIPLLAIATYAGAIQAFPYGDKSWLNFLPQNWKHFTSGFFYGLASAPILYFWSIPLAIISGGTFYCIKKFKVNNPLAELLRGGIGTCLL